MSFFDLVFGKRETVSTDLNKLHNVVEREKEEAVKEILPRARGKSREINALFKELKNVIAKFASEEPRVFNEKGMQIAKEMRENIVARIPALPDAQEDVEKLGYFELVEFYEKNSKKAHAVTKITSDNRYIFAFYRNTGEKLKATMRELASKIEALGKMMEEKKEAMDKFGEIEKKISELKENIEEERKTSERAKQLEKEADGREKEIKMADEAGLQERMGCLEKQNAEKNREIEETKAKITSRFVLLERALRKFSRKCGKREEKIAQKLLEDAFGHVIEGEGRRQARELLELLKQSVERGEIELKNEGRVLEAVEFISRKESDEVFGAYEKKIAEKKEIDEELSKFEARKNEMNKSRKKLEETRSELEKNKGKEKELNEKIMESKEKIKVEFEKITGGKKLVLMD